jgi:superfamily II DNA helicase RecQ
LEIKNVILIAGTGWGKSLIFHAPPALSQEKTITVIVLPVKGLEFDQIRAIILEGAIKKNQYDELMDGIYTHVLVSPEVAISQSIRPLLQDERFSRRIDLIAIDDAHLVVDWGEKFPGAHSQNYRSFVLI